MPFQKLITMEKFSDLRIKQLWDDCRIFAAWFSSIKSGKQITDRKTGQSLSVLDVVKRYAHARGLLWALGFPIGPKRMNWVHGKKSEYVKPFKPKVKRTSEFKQMFKLALPSIKYYYSKYRGKVKRGS